MQRESELKARKIVLNLTDEECRKLAELAGELGLTAGGLLEEFVGDLTDGYHTNGSDERMYASLWLTRCGFSMFADKTFLRWLLAEGSVDDVLQRYDIIELYDGDNDPEALDEIEYQIACIKELYADYAKATQAKNAEPEPYENALAGVLAWGKERDKLIKGEKN